LIKSGYKTGASTRNWTSYGNEVALPPDFPDWKSSLLTDPQTSGGLLIACSPANADALRNEIEAAGYPRARIIGSASEGPAQIRIS
jgi:selenide,water dikinase